LGAAGLGSEPTSLWEVPAFRHYLAGIVLVTLANQMQATVVAYQLYELTHDRLVERDWRVRVGRRGATARHRPRGGVRGRDDLAGCCRNRNTLAGAAPAGLAGAMDVQKQHYTLDN